MKNIGKFYEFEFGDDLFKNFSNLDSHGYHSVSDEFVCWSFDAEPYTKPSSKKCDGNPDCEVQPWTRNNITQDETKYLCHDPESKYFSSVVTPKSQP